MSENEKPLKGFMGTVHTPALTPEDDGTITVIMGEGSTITISRKAYERFKFTREQMGDPIVMSSFMMSVAVSMFDAVGVSMEQLAEQVRVARRIDGSPQSCEERNVSHE